MSDAKVFSSKPPPIIAPIAAAAFVSIFDRRVGSPSLLKE
jgi:hypothetical protein